MNARLTAVREKLDRRLLAKRQQRLEPRNGSVLPEHIPVTLTPGVSGLLALIHKSLQEDRVRLLPPPAPGEETPALPPAPVLPIPPALQELADAFQASVPLLPRADRALVLPPQVHGAVLAFLQDEFTYLSDTTQARPPTPAPLLMKLRQATSAYSEGRVSDSITLLKNALNGDPHNQSILACLSQILYGLANLGNATALPEARDYAQRSMIASEQQRPARLELYQYLALITERAFSEDRTLEWLRTTNLLNPALLQGHGGLMGMQSIPLRAWGLLTTLPVTTWGDHELDHCQNLLHQVVGGGALYLHWLRPLLQQRLSLSKVPEERIMAFEESVTASWRSFEQVQRSLAQFPQVQYAQPWLIKLRYLNTLVQVLPQQSFDMILCHVSLDGQSWHEHAYPQREFQAMLEDYTLSFWRLWGQSLTANKDHLKLSMFPAEDTLQEAELIPDLEAALELLRGLERQAMQSDLWDDIKPWLTRWQTDHLLAVATGSNQPRNRFAPNLSMFKTLYRRWQEPVIHSYLTSDLITETARRGGFASLEEALTALGGALRLLDDRTYGLEAAQRRALMLAQKQNPAKFAGRRFNGERSFAGSGVMRGLLPLGLLGAIFAAFMLSGNVSQAIGISLALVGLAGVLLINLSQRS